jgi:Sortase domain
VPEHQQHHRRDRQVAGPARLATLLATAALAIAAGLIMAGCSARAPELQGAAGERVDGGRTADAGGPGGEAGTAGSAAGEGAVADPADPALAGSPRPVPLAAGSRGDVETIPLRPFESLTASPPVSIRIPRIGVVSRLVRLGLGAGGVLEVPTDYGKAGWFADGPEPGQVGPAVIAGRVDSKDGPAVFYRLRELRGGDEIAVERADGRTLVFVVEGRDQFPKDAFPSETVFGPVAWPALRLITCGGSFDRSAGSYRDNVIVYARLRDASPSGMPRP